MYVCMNIKCGSMSPFLNLVHRFKLYKCKLAVKSVCMGDPHDPHDPAPHPLPFVQVRWCLLVLLICFCFFFCFFNLVLPFFFNEDRRVCGSALWNVHVLWSCVSPSSPATTNLCSTPRLRSLSASRIALNDDATQPHFRNKSVCL